MAFSYHLYNLNISSEIDFPDLEEVHFSKADITIKQGKVVAIQDASGISVDHENIRLELREQKLRIQISKGNSIVYEEYGKTNSSLLRGCILASGLGAIFHQRGYQVLHGSAINYKGKAVLFCGNSGMGKSNTAAMFVKKGYPLIADDICPIIISKSGTQLLTSFMNLKLSEEDIDTIELRDFTAHNWNDDEGKLRVVTDYKKSKTQIDISAIYMLEPSENNYITIESITGKLRLQYLIKNTFRYHFIHKTPKASEDLFQYAVLGNDVATRKLKRPIDSETRKELFEKVIRDLIQVGL